MQEASAQQNISRALNKNSNATDNSSVATNGRTTNNDDDNNSSVNNDNNNTNNNNGTDLNSNRELHTVGTSTVTKELSEETRLAAAMMDNLMRELPPSPEAALNDSRLTKSSSPWENINDTDSTTLRSGAGASPIRKSSQFRCNVLRDRALIRRNTVAQRNSSRPLAEKDL